MSAQIKEIIPDREAVKAEAIALLEQALQEAREGNVLSCGLAIVRPGGCVSTAWSRSDWIGPLAGAASQLNWRINQAMSDEG